MRSTVLPILFLCICSQQCAYSGTSIKPNQQPVDRIEKITSFSNELEEFLQCVSVKTTAWQRFFGTEKWISLGLEGQEQYCQIDSWSYKKNGTLGVHELRGAIRDFTFEDDLEVDKNGSLEFSTEVSLSEKKDQLLLILTSKQIQNELKTFIEWCKSNPKDLQEKEIDALNNLKSALRKFLSAFKKQFGDEQLIERNSVNSFLALKLPSKGNRKALAAFAIAGGILTMGMVAIAIGKLTGPAKKVAYKG